MVPPNNESKPTAVGDASKETGTTSGSTTSSTPSTETSMPAFIFRIAEELFEYPAQGPSTGQSSSDTATSPTTGVASAGSPSSTGSPNRGNALFDESDAAPGVQKSDEDSDGGSELEPDETNAHDSLSWAETGFKAGYEHECPAFTYEYETDPYHAAYMAAMHLLLSVQTDLESVHYCEAYFRLNTAYGHACAAYESTTDMNLEKKKSLKKAAKAIDKAVIEAACNYRVIGNEPFYCIVCKRKFKTKPNLQRHLGNHQKDDTLRCCSCNNIHSRMDYLLAMMKKYMNAGLYY